MIFFHTRQLFFRDECEKIKKKSLLAICFPQSAWIFIVQLTSKCNLKKSVPDAIFPVVVGG